MLMPAYAHGGWGTPTASQHNIFYSENLTNFIFLVFLTGFELGSLMSYNLEPDALPVEPPVTPTHAMM